MLGYRVSVIPLDECRQGIDPGGELIDLCTEGVEAAELRQPRRILILAVRDNFFGPRNSAGSPRSAISISGSAGSQQSSFAPNRRKARAVQSQTAAMRSGAAISSQMMKTSSPSLISIRDR